MESFDSSQNVRLARMKAQHLIRIRARLHRLQKSSGFDFALKGRGFKPRHTKYEKNCGFSR
jgi:hypothetical protein